MKNINRNNSHIAFIRCRFAKAREHHEEVLQNRSLGAQLTPLVGIALGAQPCCLSLNVMHSLTQSSSIARISILAVTYEKYNLHDGKPKTQS